MRKFGVSRSFHQSLDPFAEPKAVVGNIEKVIVGRRIDGQICCRYVINRVVREKRKPFGQPPFIEQFGFSEQESSTSVRAMVCITVPPSLMPTPGRYARSNSTRTRASVLRHHRTGLSCPFPSKYRSIAPRWNCETRADTVRAPRHHQASQILQGRETRGN